jgi:hypothetical protein
MIRNCLLFSISAILLLSFSLTASAQDSLNVRCLNQYHHNWENCVVDVCIDGDYAYLACENDGLRILNISDPDHFVEITHYPAEGVYSIAKSGNYIYMGLYYDLRIIDVSDPLHPAQVQTVPIEGRTLAIRIFGNYAYVCKMYTTTGLTIIDISDPNTAHIVSQPPDLDGVYDIEVRNDTAFVAAGWDGLRLLDISDINYPQFLYEFTNENHEGIIGIAVVGNYAYIGCVMDGLRTLDLTTMQVVNTNDTLFYCLWLKKNNGLLYAEFGVDYYQLATVDISNPISPAIASIYLPPYGIQNFCLSGDRAYIADYDRGLRVLDISSPSSMDEIYSFNYYGMDIGLVVSGNYAYVQNDLSLAVVDVSDIQHPRETGRLELTNHILELRIKDNIAYILKSSFKALCTVDISNPSSPTLLDEFEAPNDDQYSLGIYDHYAYMGEADSIRILDISDPHAITQARIYRCDRPWHILAVYDHYMIYNQAEYAVEVADLTDPLHPQVIQHFNMNEYSHDAAIAENRLYIVSTNYLRIYDIVNWSFISETNLSDLLFCAASSIVVSGNYAYLGGETVGLTVIDISDPAQLELAGYYECHPGGFDVALSGNTILLASGTNLGFYEFTPTDAIDDPSQPKIPTEFAVLPNYPNPFNNSTTIRYELPLSADVTIDIYDIAGRHIQTLLSEKQSAGYHELNWDSKSATSGIYFYKITADEFTDTRKMILMK